MASLRELQLSFAAALRDAAVSCAVQPPEHLEVYRNNAGIAFRKALAQTFPVVRRRVGDDYFRQLAAHYRAKFPSRSGDLHFVGQHFARFLEEHLRGSDYAWLADLAQLEWLRAESAVCSEQPAMEARVLAEFAPEQLPEVVFELQPSLRLHHSPFPIFSVWRQNQVDNAPPVDQLLGKEHGMLLLRRNIAEVQALAPGHYDFIRALSERSSLAEAMASASLDERGLTDVLAVIFGSGLVTHVRLPNQSPNR